MNIRTISCLLVPLICVLAERANAQGLPPPPPIGISADFSDLLGYVLTPPSTDAGTGGLANDFDDGDTAIVKSEFVVENTSETLSTTFYYKIEKTQGGSTTTISTSSHITLTPGAKTTIFEDRSWLNVQDTFSVKYTVVEVVQGVVD